MKTQLASYLEALNWRYATKEFDPTKKIPSEVLEDLLEALRLSASSFGLQAWKFVLVRNPELRQQLLAESNGQRQVVDASELLVLCRLTDVDASTIDRHIAHTAHVRNLPVDALAGFSKYLHGWFAKPAWPVAPWLDSQLYIAMGNLLSACAIAQVDACPMEGFSRVGYDRVLQLPEQGLKCVLAVPMGYRSANDKYAKLAKVRYPKSELVITL